MKPIPQLVPVITAADQQAVAAYMGAGGWMTEFKETERFAAEVAQVAGTKHGFIAPSGTAALFLAIKACGIGAGDEVIVPDLTMAASATAPILAGATVRFCDIEPTTLCLDLARAETMLTPRTRAIIVVSLNGRAPAGLGVWAARIRAKGVRVIEDAAQSLGSWHEGRMLGTIGDIGIYSFSPHKIVTTGQGGAIVTDSADLAQQVRRLRDFGRDQGGADHYAEVGWNFKFTDLQAALGRSQLARLPELVATKRRMYARYRAGLAGIPGATMPAIDLVTATPWFMDLLVPAARKSGVVAHLAAAGIGTRPFYPALHAEPAFAAAGEFPVAEAMTARGVWLPSSLDLTDGQIDDVCGVVRSYLSA